MTLRLGMLRPLLKLGGSLDEILRRSDLSHRSLSVQPAGISRGALDRASAVGCMPC